MTDTTTFVLVHGSWQGGWAWDQVGRRLRAHGHRVLAPTLPGHRHRDENRAMITHQDYVAAVCNTLDAAGGEPVVLVGHSLGGMVISQVADRRPDRVGRLVYHAAFVPGDGEALGDAMPAEMRLALQQLAAASPDRSMRMPWLLWRDGFMQAADERLARRVYDRLVPEPYRPVFTDPPVPADRRTHCPPHLPQRPAGPHDAARLLAPAHERPARPRPDDRDRQGPPGVAVRTRPARRRAAVDHRHRRARPARPARRPGRPKALLRTC